MLKKIISVIIITLFINNSAFATINFGNVKVGWSNKNLNYTNIWELNKQIIISTLKIKKIEWWALYLSKLDKIEKLINSTESIETLNVMTELNNKKNINNRNLSSSDNMNFEIYKLIDLKIKKKIFLLEEEKYNNVINLVNNSWISKEEIKKVENEIVKLQLTLLDNSKSIAEKILSNINDNLNYEDNWNMKFDLVWNSTNFWSWKVSFNMPNYKIKTEKFDSELQSQMDLLIESSLIWKDSFKVQFSSFVDFITKDSNIYLLMNKLNYSWIDKIDNTWKIEKVLKKLKFFASNNEYLKIEQDENWWNEGIKEIQHMLNLYKNSNIWDINSLYNKWQGVLKSPMFNVYKKVWNKYLIIPSKEACDTIMSMQYKFQWKWNLNCSDGEYFDMVKEIVKTWDLYIILWKKINTIWFNLAENPEVTLNAKLNYSNTKIENLNLKITPKDEKYTWEFLELDFVNWQKLDVLFNAKSDDVDLSFKSLLDKDNYFSKIDYVWNFPRNLNTSFKLENGSFKWNFYSKKDWHDNNYGKAIEWNYIYNWKITWSIKNHEINWFNFEASWKDAIKNQDIFLVKLKLINNIITWTTKAYDNNEEILNIATTWKYDKDIFELNNQVSFKNIFSTEIGKARDATRKSDIESLRSAIEQYYQDNAEYPTLYNFDEIKTFIANIPEDPLKNVEINWCKFGYNYAVWDDNNWVKNQVYVLSSCMESWEVLKLGITQSKVGLAKSINWYTTWVKQEKQVNTDNKIKSNLDFKYYWDMYNYNREMNFDVFISNKDYIKWKLTSDNKRTKTETLKIKKPSNIKIIDDLE